VAGNGRGTIQGACIATSGSRSVVFLVCIVAAQFVVDNMAPCAIVILECESVFFIATQLAARSSSAAVQCN
jgi:hypothetical protein